MTADRTHVERAHRFSEQVLKSLHALGLPPSPENYATWYLYSSGAHGALVDQIDSLLASQHGISNDALRALHDRYLGTTTEAEGLDRVSSGVETTLRSILGHIGTAGASAVQHGQTLGTLSGALHQAEPGELAGLVASLIAEAERMAKANRQLEERLNQSAREIARLRSDLESVRLEANTDPLTGLSNRRAFERAVADRLGREHAVVLLMLDLDHFHTFNDTHGHQTGDQVLRLVGRTITSLIPPAALACRFGGEEFCVALPSHTLEQGRQIAETIRNALASRVLRNRKTDEVLGSLTLSIGVARHTVGESQYALFARTESALLAAKETGRNRVCCDEDLTDDIEAMPPLVPA